jgi:hypothetical protein
MRARLEALHDGISTEAKALTRAAKNGSSESELVQGAVRRLQREISEDYIESAQQAELLKRMAELEEALSRFNSIFEAEFRTWIEDDAFDEPTLRRTRIPGRAGARALEKGQRLAEHVGAPLVGIGDKAKIAARSFAQLQETIKALVEAHRSSKRLRLLGDGADENDAGAVLRLGFLRDLKIF